MSERPGRAGAARPHDETDVLVVGGGAAGMAAAASAARAGARVILAERYGFLGGTLTAVTLGSICGLYCRDGDKVTQIVRGFASDLIARMWRSDGVRQPEIWLSTASLPYDPEQLKRAADDLMEEAGVRVLFHTAAVDVVREGDRLTGVVFQGLEGRWTCRAAVVIDCSGDAVIADMAGEDWECDPRDLQFPTTMMRFAGVRTERLPEVTRPKLHGFLEEAVRAGYALPRTAGGLFSFRPGIVHLNITRVTQGDRAPDPLSTEEMSRAETAGRRMAELYLAAFRAHVPGFEEAYLLDTGAQIGVRESRRVLCEHVLQAEDVLQGRRFDDAIGCCAWPVEEHGADRATRWVWLPDGVYYQIPFRCLVPRRVEGLLVAGRCASASHEAQASLRVVGPCMAMGQAAGLAAVLAVRHDTAVRDVGLSELRGALLAQGAFLGEAAEPAQTAMANQVARRGA